MFHHYPLGEFETCRGALVTEKAFPENEIVVSTAASASGCAGVGPPIVIDERTIIDARDAA